jgi:hypothetical protein
MHNHAPRTTDVPAAGTTYNPEILSAFLRAFFHANGLKKESQFLRSSMEQKFQTLRQIPAAAELIDFWMLAFKKEGKKNKVLFGLLAAAICCGFEMGEGYSDPEKVRMTRQYADAAEAEYKPKAAREEK